MTSNRREFFQVVGTGTAGMTIGAEGLSGPRPRRPLPVRKPPTGRSSSSARRSPWPTRGTARSAATCSAASTTSSASRTAPTRPARTASCRRRGRSRGRTCSPPCGGATPRRRTWTSGTRTPYYAFRDHWNYDDVSEDCLRLNVFTPALADGKKRPVLVWLHGGGFANGNGIEHDGYNGENFARLGDVVFVSINHRLGPLGYCDLAGASARSSPRPATSACSTAWPPSSGSATTSRASAATPAT